MTIMARPSSSPTNVASMWATVVMGGYLYTRLRTGTLLTARPTSKRSK